MATIQNFWEQQQATYDAEQKAAQTDLTQAQARVTAVKARLEGVPAGVTQEQIDGDLKTLAKIGADIAAKRAQLATAAPPDAEGILDDIVQLIIKQRGRQGAVIDDQDEADAARAAADAAAATLARAKARSASAGAKVASAKADAASRTALKTAVGKAPLKTLKSAASSLLSGATAANAKKRIDKNFPAAIQKIAAKRRDTRVNRLAALQTDLDNATDALVAGQVTDTNLAGKAIQKRIAFERAQAELATYVATAATRFEQAKTVLTSLEAIELAPAGTVPDILTARQQAELADLGTKGAAAETTAENIDKDLNDVFSAESALAAQMLTSIAADVDKLGSDTDIAKKRKAIADARKTFSDDLTAFANKTDLDAWEAAIPDPAWVTLLSYLDALAALTELKSTDPAALANAMDAAEDDYTKALGLAEVSARRADFLGDEVGFRQSLVTAARGSMVARLPSAVRGDSY